MCAGDALIPVFDSGQDCARVGPGSCGISFTCLALVVVWVVAGTIPRRGRLHPARACRALQGLTTPPAVA